MNTNETGQQLAWPLGESYVNFEQAMDEKDKRAKLKHIGMAAITGTLLTVVNELSGANDEYAFVYAANFAIPAAIQLYAYRAGWKERATARGHALVRAETYTETVAKLAHADNPAQTNEVLETIVESEYGQTLEFFKEMHPIADR